MTKKRSTRKALAADEVIAEFTGVTPDNLVQVLDTLRREATTIIADDGLTVRPGRDDGPLFPLTMTDAAPRVFMATNALLEHFTPFNERERNLMTLTFYAGGGSTVFDLSEFTAKGVDWLKQKDREQLTKEEKQTATRKRFALAVDKHLEAHPGMTPTAAAKEVAAIYSAGGEKEQHGWRTLNRAWKLFGVVGKIDNSAN